MRCLFCNKKLSLLKLAKGDSFCSAEHFDAYQLQLSKDAIDRLRSVGGEDVPKAPLAVAPPAVAPRDETPPDLRQENRALARLSAFALPATPEVPSPPYAPFASAPLPSFTLNPPYPIASGPETGEAVEASRTVAYPVHEAEEVACILNLYLQLNLGGTEPKDWTPEQHPMDVAPERFRMEITQPPFGASPEFPEIDDLATVENIVPDDEYRPVEAEASAEAAPLEPMEPMEQGPPELLEIEHLAPVEPVLPIEPEPPVEGHPVEALPFAEAHPFTTPVLPAAPAILAPIEPPAPRVPFLTAPSFNARNGTPIRLHTAASSVPKGVYLSPILEKDDLPRPNSSERIPNSTRFATSTAFRPQDSTVRLTGVPALQIAPAFDLPKAKEQALGDAWSPSNRQIVVDLPPFEANRASIPSIDYKMREPASLMVRPNASRLSKSDPQGLSAGTSLDVVTLFRSVLETSPRGGEPSFIDPRAEAVESVWKAIPAPFPGRKPLPSAWQLRTSYRPLPDPIASGREARMPPLEALPYAPGCIKIDRVEKARLPAPYIAKNEYRSAAWPEANAAFVRVASEPCLVFLGSTKWPRAAALPKGSLKRGSGAPTLRWQLRLSAPEAPRAVKFLPSREGAMLPAPQSWERLDAVPC